MSISKPKNWYVLYTKPKAEKKLAQELKADHIEAYCPVQTEIKYWSDRKKKVETPLLTSMIFVRIQETDRDRVFQSRNAVRYLYWLGKPAKVTRKEVESLKSMVEDSQFEKHEMNQLKPGEKLDMTHLGFEQIEGTVKFVNGRECWIVLEQLGYVIKFRKA
jgi:transcription antitermination factor NusG